MIPSMNYRPQQLLFGSLNQRINKGLEEKANKVINGFKQVVGDSIDLSALHYALQNIEQFKRLPQKDFSKPVRQYVIDNKLESGELNGEMVLTRLGKEVRRQLLDVYQDAKM